MMAGTKRRKKTGKSAAKTPSPLPSQYTFVPRSTAPPPLPNRRSGPSVSDYPPPAQLFQTSTAQPPAASDPVRQAPPPPRPRGSQTFGRDKGRLSRKIRKICTNKFDDPFYSWSVVPTDDDNELFLKSTFTSKRGRPYGLGSLEDTLVNGKRKYAECSSSAFLDLQQQLAVKLTARSRSRQLTTPS
uniref:Uncharacterized protein n=1 Tax=Brassica oleracea var. oleracea TaxID=109376 RepID=A0A0D3AN92_BRAOL